jgi:chemotaxis protein MotA
MAKVAERRGLNASTVLGLIIGVGSVLVSIAMEFGELNPDLGTPFLKVSALLIILGGTLGATMCSFPMRQVVGLTKFTRNALFTRRRDLDGMIKTLVSTAEKARREGLIVLEQDISRIDNDFMKKGLRLIVDGTDPDTVVSILTRELTAIEQRHKVGVDIFTSMGGYSPTMGIIGTVVGLIGALSKSAVGAGEETSAVVAAIATAFIATFYGIALANLIWLPLAGKLKAVSEEDIIYHDMILEGLISVQSGENPRLVEERLRGFILGGA